jgi:hypothetical protein
MVGSLTLTSLSCNLSFVLLTRCGLIGLWSVPCCLYCIYYIINTVQTTTLNWIVGCLHFSPKIANNAKKLCAKRKVHMTRESFMR